MSFEDFNRKVCKAILELKHTKPRETILIHHDDADGLRSGAIMKTALDREGYKVKTFCLEKVYPEVIESLHKGTGQTIFYVDLGSFLSYRTRLIKPSKYVFGFMNVPQEIPNWGKLKERLVKVSVRIPKNLKSMIDKGKMPGAVNLLLKASEGFGVADGHQYAASVVIPLDKKEDVIDNAEKVLAL